MIGNKERWLPEAVLERISILNRGARLAGITIGAVLACATVPVADCTGAPEEVAGEFGKKGALVPVFRRMDNAGRERFVVEAADSEAGCGGLAGTAFRAVQAARWPAALVPLFEVSRSDGFELSRLPAPGEENSSEPLFFALPPVEEGDALRLCGHWEFRAVRNGSTSLTALEMTVWNGTVSARFDQNTDYGFASFSRGRFHGNALSLIVRYIADSYQLSARLEDGMLRGDWRDLGDAEQGRWEAERKAGGTLTESESVLLFEWLRTSDGARRYVTEDGESLAEEWRKAERPLCRVWR